MPPERSHECGFHSHGVSGNQGYIYVFRQSPRSWEDKATMPDVWRCFGRFSLTSGAPSPGRMHGEFYRQFSSFLLTHMPQALPQSGRVKDGW
jgi:hypothetical protein